jgi:hypothetical protein
MCPYCRLPSCPALPDTEAANPPPSPRLEVALSSGFIKFLELLSRGAARDPSGTDAGVLMKTAPSGVRVGCGLTGPDWPDWPGPPCGL